MRCAKFIVLSMLMLVLIGCSKKTVDDVLPTESNVAISQSMTPIESSMSVTQGIIYGEFTATVRDIIPSYVLDDTTPLYAVLTDFQGPPFTVRLSENLIRQIEPDKQYVFEIQEQLIEPAVSLDGDAIALTPEVAVALYNIQVEAIRIPKEEEMGLNSNRLEIKIAGN